MKNEKIACMTFAPPSNYGGAEVVWKNLEKSFDFDFYTIKGPRDKNVYPIPKIISKLPNIFHFTEIISSIFMKKRVLKDEPKTIIYDKILGWSLGDVNAKKIAFAQGLYTPAGEKFKQKNYLVYLIYKYLVSIFEKRAYRTADKIISVSESVKHELIEYFKIDSKKIVVVNNGVNPNKFKKINNVDVIRDKWSIPREKFIILFPARNSYGKGFDIAKKVAKKLGDKVELIVLSGKAGEKDGNINYIGKVPYDLLPEIYNMADVTLFPSRYEGNSLSVLESSSCGTPLIASKVGLLSTGEALIVKEYLADNVEDYVKKIKKIMNRDNLKKASREWKIFSGKFSLEKQIKKFGRAIND